MKKYALYLAKIVAKSLFWNDALGSGSRRSAMNPPAAPEVSRSH